MKSAHTEPLRSQPCVEAGILDIVPSCARFGYFVGSATNTSCPFSEAHAAVFIRVQYRNIVGWLLLSSAATMWESTVAYCPADNCPVQGEHIFDHWCCKLFQLTSVWFNFALKMLNKK